MSNATVAQTGDESAWDTFSHRHAGHPFLDHDPLYALSEGLINSIAHEAPGFFSVDDEQFERDLARTAGFGFFLRRALGVPQDAAADGDQTFEQRQHSTSLRIDEMLEEELRKVGADQEDIDTFFQTGTKQRERIESRQAAYAGWLLLNPQYHEELRSFREQWEGAIGDVGQFPRLPMAWISDPTAGTELPPGLREACYVFFCRWGLDTLLTWDWPVPMEPDLNIGQRQNSALLSSAGMVLFVPWHLLRGEQLDLRDVVRQARLSSAPDHLLDWVNKRSDQRSTELGDARFATIRWLYRYHELALMRRYAGACAGNLHRLDYALTRVLGRKEDTIKKLRLELRRALAARDADDAAGHS